MNFEEHRAEEVLEILDVISASTLTFPDFLNNIRPSLSEDEFELINTEEFLKVYLLYIKAMDIDIMSKMEIANLITKN